MMPLPISPPRRVALPSVSSVPCLLRLLLGGGCRRRTAARGHPHGTARRRVPTTPLSPRNHASYAFAHQRLDHALLGLAIKLQRPAVHVMVALEDDPGARGRDGNRLACSHCKTKRAVDLPRAVVGVVELTCVCSKISV